MFASQFIIYCAFILLAPKICGYHTFSTAYRSSMLFSKFRETFGLIEFDEMTNTAFKSFKYGFPKGIWGTQTLPRWFWFYQFWSTNPYYTNFRSHTMHFYNLINSVLVDMQWFQLIRSCDEIKYPRCSWVFFLNLADPFEFDYELVKIINHRILPYNPPFYSKGWWRWQRHSLTTTFSSFPILNDQCYPIHSLEQISLIYIYALCKVHEHHIDRFSSFSICPRPCELDRCANISYALPGSCHSFGIHSNDFQCQCEARFTWDSVSSSCILKGLTEQDCDLDGTWYYSNFVCHCHENFHGSRCDRPYNACIERKYHPANITGLEACNSLIGLKNLCEAKPGAHKYSCSCQYPYTRNTFLNYDNCLVKQNPCHSVICIHGKCRTSKDGQTYLCECHSGYKGPSCDIKRGYWSKWTSWGQCIPQCGPSRNKFRYRSCIGEDLDCIGTSLQSAICGKDECYYFASFPEDSMWQNFMWAYILINIVFMIISGLITCIYCLRHPNMFGLLSETIRSYN